MSTENNYQEDEVTLKDLILTIQGFVNELLNNWKIIAIAGFGLGILFGVVKLIHDRDYNAKTVFLKICSNLGPQLSQNIFLNIHTKPDAIRGLCSGDTLSNILNAIGHFVSEGSKMIV